MMSRLGQAHNATAKPLQIMAFFWAGTERVVTGKRMPRLPRIILPAYPFSVIFGDTHVIAKNAPMNQQVERSLAPIETSTTKDLQKGRNYA